MIIGAGYNAPKMRNWASLHQYRGFRGASFFGERPKPNPTYFCAENTSNCAECLSCCDSSVFKRGEPGRKACKRRCTRKYPISQCTGTNGTTVPPPQPPAPPGAEMCPMVCVPDGTGVTCNYNCMGVSMNIINTDIPGEVIPLQKATSLFDRSKWTGTWAGWPSARQATGVPWLTAGSVIGAEQYEEEGILGSGVSKWIWIAALGGAGLLAFKMFK
ncbi:hypothetical protein L0244_22115 [bacterium]|nr:hypothetical protein [bacterium]